MSGIWFLANQPRCSAYNSTTQSLTNGNETPLNLNTEDFDVGAMHDTVTNNTRVTVPSDGLYYITGQISFGSGTGLRLFAIKKNGTTQISRLQVVAAAGASYILPLSCLAVLVAGDYVELEGRQDSGGALDSGSASRQLSNILQVVKLL